jgi:hypothetical protein
MYRLRSVLCGATVATLLIAGLAQPAQAASSVAADLTSWTYTDSAQPSTPVLNPAGNAPLGTVQAADGSIHTSRAYFTFDLTAFKGEVVHQANFSANEKSVADCTQTAPIEVWRTKPVTATSTWQKPPKELDLVEQTTLGHGTLCPGAYLGVDVLAPIQAAQARHEKTITFEVRVAAAAESNPALSRTMSRFALSAWANHPPVVSGEKLLLPDRPCGTLAKHPSAGGQFATLTAHTTDADAPPSPTTSFAIWPVGHPEQRTVLGSSTSVDPRQSVDLRGYPDGTVLAWNAQAHDSDDTGPAGKTCYLTVDNTAPAAAPIVSSKTYYTADYPGSGGGGVAGKFVFDAAGDRDVTSFEYVVNASPRAEGDPIAVPNHPGGRAKITVTPASWGPEYVQVRSIDAAGNTGPWTKYTFWVRDSAPFATFDVAGIGLTSHIKLQSNATDVTSFGYAVDGGAEVTVPATDRTGTGDLLFTSVGTKTIVEHAYAGQKLIGAHTDQVVVNDVPRIASDQFSYSADPVSGQPGTFTFAPRTTGVVAYLYDFGDGNRQRAAAGADGTAVLPWTPDAGGYYTITVVSVDTDGHESAAAQQSFWVIDAHPYVYADPATGVGNPLNVTLQSDVPNAVGFVYTFDGGAEQTVDGANTYVEVVPGRVGDLDFTARARLDDGSLTPPTTIQIHVPTAPSVTITGPYGSDAVVGRTATFTLTPALPDVVSYQYSFGADSGTVDAASDGTASITITPDTWGYAHLSVVSVGRDGTVSDSQEFDYSVLNPQVDTWGSTWDDWGPTGGVGQSGEFDFAGDLTSVTVKYLWHVNDGPVQEALADPDSPTTFAAYTPTASGENHLYVQREFTDGALSPLQDIVFLVG